VRQAAAVPPLAVKTAGAFAFLEGPAATDAGDLYFTDLKNNRIWKRTAQGVETVFRERANYANGLAIDGQGRLLAAENGDPAAGTPARITRTDLATGRLEVLASGFGGKALSGPNDLVVDGRGRIFFTDRARPPFIPPLPGRATNPFAVYRIDPDGEVRQILAAPQVHAPNGVMVAPDDRTLYLVDSDQAAGGVRRIDAYPLNEDGSIGPRRLFHDFAPGRGGDGMVVDRAGNLWVTAGLNAPRPGGETLDTRAGVYQFAPDGRLLRFLPIGEDLVTNVAFGGPSRNTLYITAGKTLFEVPDVGEGTRR
jgi:gluconolactonase